MQLELRHLRALCAIADAGSLSRAAATIGISQPALTAQLHRIEEALGGQVFRRGRLGVAPTPFGLFVLSRARSVLVTVDELRTGSTAAAGSEVRVGGYATPVLTGLLNRLFALPGARITVHTEYSPQLLLDLLCSGRLDAATLVDYPDRALPVRPAVETRLIAVEPVFVALPATHRLAGRDEVALAELADEDWLVTPPDGAGWPEIFYSACQDAGFAPRVRHMMAEHDMIRDLVGEGRAIAPCQATLRTGADVAVLPLTGTPLRIRHLLAWRRDGPLAARAAEFAEFAAEAHREAVAAAPGYAAWIARGGGL
ncbi:LysR family transcriptional regulator [Spirillospora sp. CA-294931]|uniref:LysR family transcriptional regulator n=1 Tax=Spirillospora sp. CA-294931 TaxID=3240042 RepID=UPI003D8E28D3